MTARPVVPLAPVAALALLALPHLHHEDAPLPRCHAESTNTFILRRRDSHDTETRDPYVTP